MSTDCQSYEAELRETAIGGTVALSDRFARHLDDCASCRRVFDRGAVPLDPASFERLEASARARLLHPAIAAARWRPWMATAAAAAALVTLGLLALAGLRFSEKPQPSVEVALVEDHIRYLADVDRRGVRTREVVVRELDGYVDFPVLLPDGGTAALTGARRCYLLGRRVVLAFYEEGGSPLSYFVLPAEGLLLPGEVCGGAGRHCVSEHGFSVVTWRQAGLLHGVVAADLSTASRFAEVASSLVP